MGLVAQAEKNYGEAVARMKKAVELLGEAEKKGEGVFKPYVGPLYISVISSIFLHSLVYSLDSMLNDCILSVYCQLSILSSHCIF